MPVTKLFGNELYWVRKFLAVYSVKVWERGSLTSQNHLFAESGSGLACKTRNEVTSPLAVVTCPDKQSSLGTRRHVWWASNRKKLVPIERGEARVREIYGQRNLAVPELLIR